MNLVSEEIKNRVSMPDIIDRYTNVVPRRGRIPCPLHNGRNYSFSFNDVRFCCFKCGAKGDIFDFVCQLFGIDYGQAIVKLNYDFGLNLPLGRRISARDRKKMSDRTIEIQKQKEIEKKKESDFWDRYFVLMSQETDYERLIEQFKPISPEAEISDIYVKALYELTNIRTHIEEAEVEAWKMRSEKSQTSQKNSI